MRLRTLADIPISDIVPLQQKCILRWKEAEVLSSVKIPVDCLNKKPRDFLTLVEENHAYNYQLWQTEDKARRDDKGYAFVYRAKRNIDRFNQLRNNCMEAIDEWLFATIKPADPKHCPVHSETPGMMIDRLSILALKIYHMGHQTKRQDATEEHRQTCHLKWQTLTQQQMQLFLCLQQLLEDLLKKKRTFILYRQFKMYNNPMLNPELY